MSERLLLVSNRLPVTLRVERGRVHAVPSTGGLARGLSGPHKRSGGLWIGWPGNAEHLPAAQRAGLSRELAASGLRMVELSRAEVLAFYDGFCNGVLWPLLHYLLDRIPLDAKGWVSYRRVNARFADAVAHAYRPGDLVWVHDYQLLLLPQMIRERLPGARIGFFLHTPFPAAEVFSIFPWRDEALRGLLGADLIGFHTVSYMRNFAASLVRALGIEADVDRIAHQGREVALGVFPIGIDGPGYRALAEDGSVGKECARIRSRHDGQRLLLAIDRLDYTKGILRRLTAVDRLLERHRRWRGKVTLLQIAVPSREKVPEYQRLRSQVNELVGHVNASHATLSWTPIQHISRSFSEKEVAALYRAADVMLVTPLRDGMNLVAKEFVASRLDEDGVLVLSELAGAASELGEAVQVNPYDIDGTADALDRALRMDRPERRRRMRALRERVFSHDIHWWSKAFVDALASTGGRNAATSTRQELASLRREILAASPLALILDYDGTLVPFTSHPSGAAPDAALLLLLAKLARRPDVLVNLVSGRSRDTLEGWFGHLPAGLHAEHGLWSRPEPGGPWSALAEVSAEWKDRVRAIMDLFVARTPGSLVEVKTSSIAWHYRHSDPELGTLQANRLRLHLGDLFRNAPVQVLPGDRVVEVRHQAVHKGLVVAAIRAATPQCRIVAIGDDLTDEDIFAALPPDGIPIHVGTRATRAPWRLSSPAAVRDFLHGLLRSTRAVESPRRKVSSLS